MNPQNLIFDLIKKNEYITMDMFMEIALSKDNFSYYKSKNPFDLDSGDFITSPEISQMFGEMLGIWIYNQWILLGKNTNISLVELGPGTGTLMRDILNVLKKTDMFEHINIFLLEINPVLLNEQKNKLSEYSIVKWIENLSELPNKETIFIANEFFDALPTKQFIKDKSEWKEVIITLNQDENKLIFEKISITTMQNTFYNLQFPGALDGAIIEISYATEEFIKSISKIIHDNRGAALFIDYGYDLEPKERSQNQFNSTIQAIKNHKFSSILENIGTSDITAHVDFSFIRKVATSQNIRSSQTLTQENLLHKLGIFERMSILASKNPELSNILYNQYNRLTSKNLMGNLFKSIAITNKEDKLFIFDY